MIGRCVANRPYMYLPLKGDTNDYSVNAQNPSNTGVATTTGEFGESNGAYEWGSGDYLEYSNTIGNVVAGYFENNATFLVNIFPSNSLSTSAVSIISFWYATISQRSVEINLNNPDNGLLGLLYSSTGSNSEADTSTDIYDKNTWFNLAVTFNNNDNNVFINGSSVFNSVNSLGSLHNATLTKLSIGYEVNNAVRQFLGKMYNLRIYSQTLSNGALSILNNEKGRIRA